MGDFPHYVEALSIGTGSYGAYSEVQELSVMEAEEGEPALTAAENIKAFSSSTEGQEATADIMSLAQESEPEASSSNTSALYDTGAGQTGAPNGVKNNAGQ